MYLSHFRTGTSPDERTQRSRHDTSALITIARADRFGEDAAGSVAARARTVRPAMSPFRFWRQPAAGRRAGPTGRNPLVFVVVVWFQVVGIHVYPFQLGAMVLMKIPTQAHAAKRAWGGIDVIAFDITAGTQ